MKKSILLLLLLSIAAFALADVIIGTGVSTGRYPLNDYFVYSRSQCIYTAAEIGVPAGGTITHLKWYRNDAGADPNAIGTTEIWLTETASTTLSTWQPEGTLVATISNIDLGAGAAWYTVDITDYAYTGSNLMVSVRTQNAPYTAPHSYWRYTSTSPNYMSLLGNSDSTNPPSVSTSYYRPNITLVGITQATPPGIASLVFPTPSGVTGVVGTPTLQWTPGTGTPTQYDIYFGQTLPPEGSPTVSNHLLTSWSPGTLAWNTTYSWKIVPENAYGSPLFADCPTWTFTTMADPTIYLPPDHTQNFGTTGAPFPPTNWNKYSGVLGSPTVLGAPGTGSWYQDDWRNVTATPQNYAARINIYSTLNGWLISPPVSVPGNDYEMMFDLTLNAYATSNAPGLTGTDDIFAVLIGDGTSWTPANVVRQWDNAGSPYVYNNINYLGETVNIPLGAAGTKYIAFYGISTVSNADNDLMVDNVVLRQIPTSAVFNLVPDVTDFSMGNVLLGSSSAQAFRVTNTGGANLTFNSVGVSGTGFSAFPAFDSSPILPGQFRDFTVLFEPNAEGPFTGTLTFDFNREVRTVNLTGNGVDATITYPELPYTTSFEDAWIGSPAAPGVGWSVVNANADSYTWRRGATYIPANTGAVFAQGMGNTNDWLVTPPISTGTYVRLNWYDRVESASYPNSYKVLVSTTDNQPASFTTELADITCNWLTWTQHTLDINNTSGTMYVAFYQYASGSTAWDFGIDDLMLSEAPTGPPTAPELTYPLGLTGMPQAGFDLTWTPGVGTGPVDYYIVYFWDDTQSIGDGPQWSTTGLSLDPTNPPVDPVTLAPQTPITFGYLDRWNWAVQAWADGYPAADAFSTESWFEIQADPTVSLPYPQDFGNTLTWPSGWTQSYSGAVTSDRWAVSNTNMAGGVSNEMHNTWVNAVGVSRLITPPVNTTGVPQFMVSFNHLYDDYGAGITAKLQYSHDLSTWFDTGWSITSGGGNVSGYTNVLISGLSAPITYVAWTMDGNHYQYDNWYVDDVLLAAPAAHDVGPVSWDYPNQVVAPNTPVVPLVTVQNFGVNTETFTVTVDIGTYSETVQVFNLPSFATQQVAFPGFIPPTGSAEQVIITTTLGTDTVPGNDVFYSILACLDLDIPALANNAQTDQFVQFNLSAPGTLYPLPTGYTGTYFLSGADWMNGHWMGVEYDDGTLATDNYYEVDPLTGVYLPTLGEPGASIMDVAYDDDNNILYGLGGTNGTLYTMNPVTGLAAPVAVMWYNNAGTPTNLPDLGGLMIGAAYDNLNNVLYGVDLGNDCLWTINPTTAELGFVGYFGVDFNYAQDTAFDQTSGKLFHCGYSTFGGLYWIDTATGAAFLIGNLGTASYELDGFAIPYGTIAAPVASIDATGTISWPPVEGDVHYLVYKATEPYGTYTLVATVYGTSYVDPFFAGEDMGFYKVVAVGGVRANHVPVQSIRPVRHKGTLGTNKPANIGIAR